MIIDLYLTLKQSLNHMAGTKGAGSEYPWPNDVRYFGQSVQIKGSKKTVKL